MQPLRPPSRQPTNREIWRELPDLTRYQARHKRRTRLGGMLFLLGAGSVGLCVCFALFSSL
jgi:hypothetical protein